MRIEDIEKAFRGRTPGIIGTHHEYAVLVPFIRESANSGGNNDTDHDRAGLNDTELSSNELHILYEVRAAGIMQPGEVCFPGGHVEEGETPEECAVRETCEELGVSRENIRIIAQGDTLYGGGNFTLHTFIGELYPSSLSMLRLDPDEVADVFTVPVKVLMETEPEHYGEKMRPEIDADFPYEKVGIDRDYPWRTSEHDIPVYDIDGRIIWGMTARITERVITILNKK